MTNPRTWRDYADQLSPSQIATLEKIEAQGSEVLEQVAAALRDANESMK
jgi:predicted RNase H-like HicB family nuclease